MKASEITSVGVVGAGQMGRGIAQVAARVGIDVVLVDSSADLAAGSKDKIARALARLVEKEKISSADAEATLGRIEPAGSIDAVGPADLIVEAAPESMEVKSAIFSKLDGIAKSGAILASNTSSISITKIAAQTNRPEHVIGMHFMNPVPVMKLVEIVRGLATDDATYAATAGLAERMGKTTIVSRDVPGFIVNRVLIPLLNEACFALFEGLGTADDIDTGCQLGLAHLMGPLALADLIGLDTCLAIAEVLHSELGDDKYRPCPLLRQHVAAGWLGRKTGRGFYRYDERGKKIG